MSKLINRLQFLVSLSFSINRYRIDLYSLVNIKVNSFLFINITLTYLLTRNYSTYIKLLLRIILVTSYNNKDITRITYFIHLSL